MKWFKSLATLLLMGAPAWVILAGVLQPGGSTLVVMVPEPGVEVHVDGRAVRADVDSRTFGPVEVDPGEHSVRIRIEGAVVFEKAARVAAGETAEVRASWKTGQDEGRSIPGLELEGMQREGHIARVTAVGQAGDGSMIVSVAADGTLRLWDARSAAEIGAFEAHTGAVRGLAVSQDGRRAVTIGDDQLLRVWDLPSGQVLKTVSTGANSNITCSAATRDATLLALGTGDGRVTLIDVETGRLRREWSTGRSTPGGLAFSPDEKTLAVGLSANPVTRSTANLYDIESGRLIRELRGHRGPVWGVAFLPDGRRLLTAGGDRVLKMWEVETGLLQRSFEGHPGALLSVAVSPDGRFAVAGSGHYWAGGWRNADFYGMHMWDLVTGQVVGCLETPSPVSTVTFSKDSRRLVAGGEDRVVRSWDLPDAASLVSRRLSEAPTASRMTTTGRDKG